MKYFLIYSFFYLLLHQIHLITNMNSIFLSFSSNITIKINKTGRFNIYNNGETIFGLYSMFEKPKTIYINGKKQESISNQYDFKTENNIIKLEWDEPLSICSGMFWDCSEIIEIDFSEFDSSKNSQMLKMFEGCSSLTSINFENFDTSKVIYMGYMFYGCHSLTSLDLSNFNTSQATWMNNMFENCFSLISLNLSHFDTSKVTEMPSMFANCHSLTYLDISNFNTSIINKMNDMFYNCSLLTTLNLSSFTTSKVTNINKMFSSCSKLEYLNIQNFHINDQVYYEIMFAETPNNLVICTDKTKINKIMEEIQEKTCAIIECSEDWRKKRKKLSDIPSSCLSDCKSSGKYEYNGKCLSNCFNLGNYKIIINNEENFCGKICPKENPFLLPYEQKCIKECEINDINKKCFLTYINDDSDDLMLNHLQNNLKINTFIDQNNDIIIEGQNTKFNISKFDITNNLQNFEDCKNSFNIIYSDIFIKNEFYILTINSLNNTKKFYEVYYPLDNDKTLIKLDLDEFNDNCYLKTDITKCMNYSIKSIIKDKCISCKNGYYPYLNNEEDYFVKCLKYPFEEKYLYLIENECYNFNTKFIPNNIKCINDCRSDEIYRYEFNNVCYKECPSNTIKSKNNEFYCEILCTKELPYEIIENHTCVSHCSISDIYKNICKKNFIGENEPKKTNLGVKIVEEILNGNMGDLLEQVLQNNSIVIKENNTIHHITSLNNQKDNNNLSTIVFGDCEDRLKKIYNIRNEEIIIYKIEHKIEGFNIPIIEYALFNENGSIRLNLSICENIKVKYNIPVLIDEKELYKYDPSSDFYNNECNKYSTDGKIDMTLFDRKNEFNKNNLSLCESKCDFNGYNKTTSDAICNCNIENDLFYSINDIHENSLLYEIKSEKSGSNLGVTQCYNIFTSPEDIKSNSGFFLLLIILVIFLIVFILFCIKGRNLLENEIDEIIHKKFKNDNIEKKSKRKALSTKNVVTSINLERSTNKKRKKKKNQNKSINKTKSKKINNDDISNNKVINKSTKNLIENKNLDIVNDYELNKLSYIDALKYDKRSCCDYYTSLIKNKQIIAFTFCSFNDYNSGIIKKYIFFLSFALHYTINALFFTDSTMHKIYEDDGKYNISYQFPKILISSICSTIILRIMLITLVLTDKSVLEVKNQKTKNLAIDMKKKVMKCIKIKYTIFFVLNFTLLVLFWFYLTCFNGVYQNTQTYLIENTLISFGISLIYPFIINIIPSALRFSSFDKKNKNKKESCLYKISLLMQLL